MYTGLYVEKGRDPELAGVVKAAEVLRSNWYWFQFLEEAGCDALSDPIKTILKRSGCRVHVMVGLLSFGGGYQTVEFEIRTPTVTFDKTEGSAGTLEGLLKSEDLPDLVKRIKGLSDDVVFRRGWVNVTTGIRARYGSAEANGWGAREIWHDALEPWMPWVR
ncbi:MAG: hypothetical protein JXC32_08145 [Anaerolineae bacterium]|nr:hypothetical protein [Anaerolineae bacterium]